MRPAAGRAVGFPRSEKLPSALPSLPPSRGPFPAGPSSCQTSGKAGHPARLPGICAGQRSFPPPSPAAAPPFWQVMPTISRIACRHGCAGRPPKLRRSSGSRASCCLSIRCRHFHPVRDLVRQSDAQGIPAPPSISPSVQHFSGMVWASPPRARPPYCSYFISAALASGQRRK